ncbi:MAG: pilin [Patescibacteria group bacterium]|nr:pilin [Patescibacteria group bacterium]MDD5715951.1 pilin [Patescibacteria group bacterium]
MKKITVGLLTAAAVLLPVVASAQVNINKVNGSTFNLGTADLESAVVNIVQWVLGFLGLVAVIMILIGGFQWMTAGGNEEKVASAKKIISAAVIGLIVILLAWAIVIFVVSQTQDWTGV